MSKTKTVEQRRAEFLEREARECRKWQRPTPFEAERNAAPEIGADVEFPTETQSRGEEQEPETEGATSE